MQVTKSFSINSLSLVSSTNFFCGSLPNANNVFDNTFNSFPIIKL